MKVVIFHHYSLSYGGGGEKIINSIVTELMKRGHRVEVHSFPIRKGCNSEIINHISYYHEGLLHMVDADIVYIMYAPLLVKLLLGMESPKIAGIHSFLPCMPFAHEPIKRAVFILRHGVLATAMKLLWNIYGYKELTYNFDAIHIPNLSNPLKISCKKIYCIPNWVDTNIFKPRKNKRQLFTVAFIGRHIWQKGWDIYKRIAHFLRRKFDDMRFISVGGSGNEKYIESIGYISSDKKLSEIYSSSHVVVYPSRADIFGLTIIESLACGTPILTSLLPSHATFVPSYFLCQTLSDYVRKILKLYNKWKNDRLCYEEISEKCRKIAMKFDKSIIFPKFEKMLLEVASEGGSLKCS